MISRSQVCLLPSLIDFNDENNSTFTSINRRSINRSVLLSVGHLGCLSVCLSVCLPVCLLICVCLPVTGLLSIPVCLSACLPVWLYFCLSVCLPSYLSVYLSVSQPIKLSLVPSIDQSIALFLSRIFILSLTLKSTVYIVRIVSMQS